MKRRWSWGGMSGERLGVGLVTKRGRVSVGGGVLDGVLGGKEFVGYRRDLKWYFRKGIGGRCIRCHCLK